MTGPERVTGRAGPASQRFSSGGGHGDPATPTLEANLGDPLVVRSLVGAANEIHTTQIQGHWFRVEPWSPTSPPPSAMSSRRAAVPVPKWIVGASTEARMRAEYGATNSS